MTKRPEEPKRRWTEVDRYALMQQIPESNRSLGTTIAARLGGFALSVAGGYVAERFSLKGLALEEAAAPGIFLNLYVGLTLQLERIAATKQTKRSLAPGPPHPWRSRFATFGSAALANAMAFGSGAALAYSAQESHNPVAAGAGAVAALIGIGAAGAAELGAEFTVQDTGESLDPPMRLHRRLFDDGRGLQPRPSGPSPQS